MDPPARRDPRCHCGRSLVVHVGVGRFGGLLIWSRCEGCGEILVPYNGPLTVEAERELRMLKASGER